MSDIDLLADAREWLATQGDRVQTHSDKCHLWHPACLVARLVRELSRAGQTDAKTGDSDPIYPERENANHDAAPAARARTDSAAGEPGGGHGSDRTDKAVTRPVIGTGDICERLRREIVWEPEVGELLAEAADEIERLTLTDAERRAIHWVIGDVADITTPAEDTLRGLLDRTK